MNDLISDRFYKNRIHSGRAVQVKSQSRTFVFIEFEICMAELLQNVELLRLDFPFLVW
jgi:hypothetical protein